MSTKQSTNIAAGAVHGQPRAPALSGSRVGPVPAWALDGHDGLGFSLGRSLGGADAPMTRQELMEYRFDPEYHLNWSSAP